MFPTNHLGIALPVTQFELSAVLSVLVAKAISDLVFSKFKGDFKKRTGTYLGGSLFSMISTTGGCCSLPFIYYILAVGTSTTTSFGVTLFFTSYSYAIDLGVIIILISLRLKSGRFFARFFKGGKDKNKSM